MDLFHNFQFFLPKTIATIFGFNYIRLIPIERSSLTQPSVVLVTDSTGLGRSNPNRCPIIEFPCQYQHRHLAPLLSNSPLDILWFDNSVSAFDISSLCCLSFDLFGGLPQSKSDYNYVLCPIYLSFVSAFIQFEICVGSDSLAFVGMDMINGSSANLILYIYCFKLWKLCVFFLGLIGNGISCLWLNQEVEFGILVLFSVSWVT